jgi:hypothetical protein
MDGFTTAGVGQAFHHGQSLPKRKFPIASRSSQSGNDLFHAPIRNSTNGPSGCPSHTGVVIVQSLKKSRNGIGMTNGAEHGNRPIPSLEAFRLGEFTHKGNGGYPLGQNQAHDGSRLLRPGKGVFLAIHA